MLSIEQCRGARGLLGWTQQNLADASGLSKTAINNFEKGHSDIKAESLRAIRMAFESAEIEFMDQNGLRKKSENVRILRGPHSLSDLLEDIAKTMSTSGGEILISNVDNTLSSQISTQRLFEHIDLLKTNNIRQRVLCVEGTKNVLSPHDECRWFPAEVLTGRLTTFVYGTKIAFQLDDQSMIIVVNSTEAHTSESKRFEQLWTTGQIPDTATAQTQKQHTK